MGNYNDFDLDIKKVQGNDNTPERESTLGIVCVTTSIISPPLASLAFSCDGGNSCACTDYNTCKNSCGVTCGGGCKP